MICTPLIQDLIRKGDIHEIKEVMKKSTNLGMQTFDQALFELYKSDAINYDTALAHADSANNLRLMIKLSSDTNPELSMQDNTDSLFLQEEEDFINVSGEMKIGKM